MSGPPDNTRRPRTKADREGKPLRWGFSTGTAASAATKAALSVLLGGGAPAEINVTLPDGGTLDIEVKEARALNDVEALATIIKDAGDDPDVTHRAAISARVKLDPSGPTGEVAILGGEGVGRVTRPGLDLAVGQPAINPVPRAMITQAVDQAWSQAKPGAPRPKVSVEISVANGEAIAKRTLNPRLGIVHGISILGTHGRVKPFSHAAYTATIDSALSVARAAGHNEVVLTTGGKSEKRAMALRPELHEMCFVQIADFFAYAMGHAAKAGMARVGLVCFFGKAVKQAMGLEYTHAHRSPMELAPLADWLALAGLDSAMADEIRQANTARHAHQLLEAAGRLDLVRVVGERMVQSARGFLGPGPELWCVILGYDQGMLFEATDGGQA